MSNLLQCEHTNIFLRFCMTDEINCLPFAATAAAIVVAGCVGGAATTAVESDDVVRVAIATWIDGDEIEDGGDEERGNTGLDMDTARNKSIDREKGETGEKNRWSSVDR
eukprot:CAMPEP_0113517052 /NCGR_PEP_ID=MMETSP0014_2-20120614/41975_1 /TAXON_ID=2857 /ORGANISM="Nitzschia sp." /LENGTH=108 /DNA_ID=CAMNT_0000414067 /DNA_START=16 /DNA_END=340 /DNA_ORIENTATION=- /assembly_acc=CAM_ASM_000159